MMTYSIQFKGSVEKDLRPLPKTVLLRVMRSIIALQDDPQPQTAVKVAGSDNLYRVRVGDYRIIYELVHEQELLVIHYIRHRRDVYRSV